LFLTLVVALSAGAANAQQLPAPLPWPKSDGDETTPYGACIRLMSEHRLYIEDGRVPNDNTMMSAVLCSRAPTALCERAMREIKTRGAPIWAKYVMFCRES